MRVWDVPIEPLEERYSNDWRVWFEEGFRLGGVERHLVDAPTLTDHIETGRFLDVYGTNYYKAMQIASLVKSIRAGEVQDGDWLFFHDLWFPGLESLAYIRSAGGPQFRISGCLHAGTWDPWDFLSQRKMGVWARHFERSLFVIADLVFVATDFHRELIRSACGFDEEVMGRIMVTGFPIVPRSNGKIRRRSGLVVFPHRLDPEKRPDLFDQLSEMGAGSGLTFSKTKVDCRSRCEYEDQLARAEFAVSFALQETWGIAMQEALFFGAIPVVPDALSYREMYPERFRVSASSDGLVRETLMKIEELRKDPGSRLLRKATVKDLADRGARAIPNMIAQMRAVSDGG